MPLFLLPALGLMALSEPPAPLQETPRCAVRVQFGSYAMGIDRVALERVQAVLKRTRGVRTVAAQRWGREGETTLCVATRRTSDVRRVFGRITAALPRTPRGPILVEGRGGLRFEAPRRH